MTAFARTVKRTQPKSLKLLDEGKRGAYLASYGYAKAIVKLAKSKTPKSDKARARGIPVEEIPYREVAFYKLAQLLEFTDIVPETVLMKIGKVTASAQRFVNATTLDKLEPGLLDESDVTTWAIKLREVVRTMPQDQVDKIILLDFLACSRDRHAHNLGVKMHLGEKGPEWKLVAWDNGLAFGINFRRYHSVLHKYTRRHTVNLEPYWEKLISITASLVHDAMHKLLSPEAMDHLWLRLQFAIEYPHLVPYKALCAKHDAPPDYTQHFQLMYDPSDQRASSTLYGLRREAISG